MDAIGRLVLVVGLLAGGAAAQTPPATAPTTPPPGNPISGITVTAPREQGQTEHQLFDRSLNFISSHGQTAHLGQIARWPEPVCVVSLGLSPQMNQFVADRVERLAFQVGAPQPGRRARRLGLCKPNVEILFTDQPRTLMDLVAKKRNKLLGYHFVANERAVTRFVHPVQAWYLTQTVGGAGANASAGGPAAARPVRRESISAVSTV